MAADQPPPIGTSPNVPPSVSDGLEPEDAGAGLVGEVLAESHAGGPAPVNGAYVDTFPLRAVGTFRWVICALLFFATMINYMDRQVLSLLKAQLSTDLHWTNTDYGNITAFFSFAYAFGYLFGGRFMDWFGVKRGLPLTVFIWSVFAGVHGLMRSVTGFSVARVGLGLSEGGIFPAAIKTVGDWFPIKERALATGIFNSASNIGAIVCPLTIPYIALRFGWPIAFYATGALGLIWIVFWVLTYETPDKHRLLSSAERTYIEEGRVQDTKPITVPWSSLLRLRATWGYVVATILPTWVWWFYLFWLPDFLQKRYHLTGPQMGLRVGVVYTMAILGSIGAGRLAGSLIERGWSVNAARKVSLLICALCVLPVFTATMASNSWVTVLVVGLAAAAHQGWSANLFTVVSDTMPKRAISSVVGLGGFASGLVSTVAQQRIGHYLDVHHSYLMVFAIASTMYLLALLFLQLIIPNIDASESQAADLMPA